MNMDIRTQKMKVREKISYGFGEFGQQVVSVSLSYYFLYFGMTFLGISGTALGTMLLIARIWDAANDPMMGIIVDNTNTRWGKCKPYIVFGCIPLAIFFLGCFLVPDMSVTAKLIWISIAYIGQGTLYTVVGIPYSTLVYRQTANPQERVSMYAYRTYLSYIVMIGLPVATPKLVAFFSGTELNMTRGFSITMGIYAVIAVIAFMLCGLPLKERDITNSKNKVTGKDITQFLKTNPYFWLMVVTFFMMYTTSSLISSSILFYINDYLKVPDKSSMILVVVSAPLIFTMIVVPILTKRIGKRKTALIGLIICILSAGVRLATKDANITVTIVTLFLGNFGFFFATGLAVPMVTDAIEYGYWKNGTKVESFALSASTFGYKLGMGVGSALAGILLDASGYVSGMAEQSQSALSMLFALNVISPILLGIVIFILYAINTVEKRMPQIYKDLAERQAAQTDNQ